MRAEAQPSSSPSSQRRFDVLHWVLLVVALLGAKRIAYHLAYLVYDPFALATVSDGQLYEEAARNIAEQPPFGTEPFYLQGLYAYLLAPPIALTQEVVVGLLLQLCIAALALLAFYAAATRLLGRVTGSISTAVLLAFSNLAFYENKYLSVALGVACNIFALWAFVRCLDARRRRDFLFAGLFAGLCGLGRPNMFLALPFTAFSLLLVCRARKKPAGALLGLFALGCALALAPMAVRNWVVTGRPDVTPSHGGGIPFFIGNNPDANGRWNTAGGLLSGQVYREQAELAARLGLGAGDPRADDRGSRARAIGDELYRRGLSWIAAEPGAWLALTGKKLWLTLGNHPFVRDYDLNGEEELLGSFYHLGLPFGVVLGLGVLGLVALMLRAREHPAERRSWYAVLLVLAGQLTAVLAANLFYFTSAQNRLPLVVPLCFVAGPALLAAFVHLRGRIEGATWQTRTSMLAVAALLSAQGFWPRIDDSGKPTSVHYYNLGSVEEVVGRKAEAAADYARALERNPKQPVFWLTYARICRQLERFDEADRALRELSRLPGLDPAVRRAGAAELSRLKAARHR